MTLSAAALAGPARLGFGCASLGSRVSPRDADAAVRRALDAGVRYFDVAPAYGRGAAETLLGAVARDRPGAMVVCTKVGLAPPPTSPMMAALMPLARAAVGVAAPLRAALRRSGATRNRRAPLTPALIAQSLDASLARLGMEQVALYALHNADPDALARDDIRAAAQAALDSGKARAICVAGDHAAAAAALDVGAPYGAIQIAQDLGDSAAGLAARARAAGVLCVTHSVFGVDGAAARLAAAPDAAALLARGGYEGALRQTVADALLDRALALNHAGVVLASMADPAHLTHNLSRAAAGPRPDSITLVENIIGDR